VSTKLTADEIVQMQHVRGFLQFGEPGAENEMEYYGKVAQYFFVEALQAPETGSISPVNMPDPMRRRKWRLVGREYTPPDLPSYNLILHEKHGRVPRALGRIGCEFQLALSVGRCKDPSNYDRGWEDYLHMLEGGVVSDKDHGTRTSMSDDTPIASTLTVTLADEYAIGPLNFGPQAATPIDAEVADGTYGVPDYCDGCQNGVDRRYLVTRAKTTSPAAAAHVVYKTEDVDWANLAITGIGAAVNPAAIRIVGSYLVVLVPSEGAYYLTTIDDLTGIPASAWIKVTTGFQVSGPPNDMYVASSSEVFFIGDAGYIYRTTDLTSGVSIVDAGSATSDNLVRIKGAEEVIIASGANGAFIKSVDAGLTFSAVTVDSVTDQLDALELQSSTRFWVGTNAGEIWWTKNGGASWHQKELGTTLAAVHDIAFASRSTGFISATSTGPLAVVFATQNGGNTWVTGRSRLPNLATIVHDRYNRIITPNTDSTQTNVNNVMLVGLDGGGTDGIALSAQAAEL